MKMAAGNISRQIRKFDRFLASASSSMTSAPLRMEMNRLCSRNGEVSMPYKP